MGFRKTLIKIGQILCQFVYFAKTNVKSKLFQGKESYFIC